MVEKISLLIHGSEIDKAASKIISISPKKAQKMCKFTRYLINNRDSLLDPDCRAHLKNMVCDLGAILGDVDKLMDSGLKSEDAVGVWGVIRSYWRLIVVRHP